MINKVTKEPVYLCQILFVFFTLSLLLSLSLHSSIDLGLFLPSFHPMLLYSLSLSVFLSFLYCWWNSWFAFMWRRRSPEDGWEDGRQRDGERQICSLGLLYLINYVHYSPLDILSLLHMHIQMVKHSLFSLLLVVFQFT